MRECGKHMIRYSRFSLLGVPIYWSNRAENALTAVALYCELVYTFYSRRGKAKPHCISVIAGAWE